MMRGRERPFQVQVREYRFHSHASETSGHEAANDGDDDVHDPPKHAALFQPGLVNPHGQHREKKDQHDRQRAAHTRRGHRNAEQ